nr:hypothetical protein [Dinophyceae sp. MRD-151]
MEIILVCVRCFFLENLIIYVSGFVVKCVNDRDLKYIRKYFREEIDRVNIKC